MKQNGNNHASNEKQKVSRTIRNRSSRREDEGNMPLVPPSRPRSKHAELGMFPSMPPDSEFVQPRNNMTSDRAAHDKPSPRHKLRRKKAHHDSKFRSNNNTNIGVDNETNTNTAARAAPPPVAGQAGGSVPGAFAVGGINSSENDEATLSFFGQHDDENVSNQVEEQVQSNGADGPELVVAAEVAESVDVEAQVDAQVRRIIAERTVQAHAVEALDGPSGENTQGDTIVRKQRRRRIAIVVIVLAVVAVVVGVSVAVTSSSSGGGDGPTMAPTDEPTMAPTGEPTMAPSPSPTSEPLFLGDFVSRQHNVAGSVYALSNRVLEVRGFRYDGQAPSAVFWADNNNTPTAGGFRLQDGAPSSSCGSESLASADGSQSHRVEFPEGTSILDVIGGSISVWDDRFNANFGEIVLPSSLPGLAATEDGPALECSSPAISVTPDGYNCEPLSDTYQVRWQVKGENVAIELLGSIGEGVYMAFGISGSDTQVSMLGADTTITDVFSGAFRARDFYATSRSQCADGVGVCPDRATALTNDASSVSGLQQAGLTLVRYTRPLNPSDVDASEGGRTVDRVIPVQSGVSTFAVWALGPIDEFGVPDFHTMGHGGNSVEFGRSVQDNCTPLL